jgi:hypothetical protein
VQDNGVGIRKIIDAIKDGFAGSGVQGGDGLADTQGIPARATALPQNVALVHES